MTHTFSYRQSLIDALTDMVYDSLSDNGSSGPEALAEARATEQLVSVLQDDTLEAVAADMLGSDEVESIQQFWADFAPAA